MLAARRLRISGITKSLSRANTTLQSSAPTSPSAPPPPSKSTATGSKGKPKVSETVVSSSGDANVSNTTEKPAKVTLGKEHPTLSKWQTRRLRKKRAMYPAIRPSISLDRPREWHRPIARGVLPAYDEALRVISRDAKIVQKEANELRAKLDKGEFSGEAEVQAKEKLDILDIMGHVNLPDVRWKARNGLADLSKPVYRHLVEKRWREEGALDLLMERIHQMKVVPDVLPDLRPDIDIRINFPEAHTSEAKRARAKQRYAPVEPGVYLVNEQTTNSPRVYATVFHTEPKLYTLLMVDPDVPDTESQSFTTYLHWLQPNISLSASTPMPLSLSTPHVPYIPPHPAKGTPYHRYTLLLLPQSSTEPITIPQLTEDARLNFNAREFVAKHGLNLTGGGAHMWRSVWDEASSKIWQDVIKKPEPKFGHMPKPDPYAEIKGKSKYFLD